MALPRPPCRARPRGRRPGPYAGRRTPEEAFLSVFDGRQLPHGEGAAVVAPEQAVGQRAEFHGPTLPERDLGPQAIEFLGRQVRDAVRDREIADPQHAVLQDQVRPAIPCRLQVDLCQPAHRASGRALADQQIVASKFIPYRFVEPPLAEVDHRVQGEGGGVLVPLQPHDGNAQAEVRILGDLHAGVFMCPGLLIFRQPPPRRPDRIAEGRGRAGEAKAPPSPWIRSPVGAAQTEKVGKLYENISIYRRALR